MIFFFDPGILVRPGRSGNIQEELYAQEHPGVEELYVQEYTIGNNRIGVFLHASTEKERTVVVNLVSVFCTYFLFMC